MLSIHAIIHIEYREGCKTYVAFYTYHYEVSIAEPLLSLISGLRRPRRLSGMPRQYRLHALRLVDAGLPHIKGYRFHALIIMPVISLLAIQYHYC